MTLTKLAFLIIMLSLNSCAPSVSILKSAEPIPLSRCRVTVHSSLDAAKSKGSIEELCIITGTSSASFSHTVATAIEKHKKKACECGATDVYLQAQDAGTLGTASATLVGFRYKGDVTSGAAQEKKKNKKQQMQNVKKCQARGGVWLEGKCEIKLE